MTDYRALVVEWFDEDEDEWHFWLIRTFDPDAVKHMLETVSGLEVDGESQLSTRYLDTRDGLAMVCSECDRISEQTEYLLDLDDEKAKCPRCGAWVFIEDCDTVEL